MTKVAPTTTLFDDPNSKPPAAPFLPADLVGVGVALVAFDGLTEVVAGAADVVTARAEAEVVAEGGTVLSAQSSSLAAINFSAWGIMSAAAHPSAIQGWIQEAEASEARGQRQDFSSGVIAEGGLGLVTMVGLQVGDAVTIAA